MPAPLIFLLVLVFAVLAILGGVWSWRQAKARREELAALAASRGWRFSPRKRAGLPRDLERMGALNHGSNRYAYNTLSGRLAFGDDPAVFHAGDYHYQITSGSGKNRRTHHYRLSYLAVRLGEGDTPRVAVRREGFFDSISAALGFDDIDFESAEFSRAFHVASDDKRFAYDLIHPRTIELLLADFPGRLELRGPWLLATAGTRRWDPAEFVHWVGWAERFLALWPRHLPKPNRAAHALTR